MTSGRHLLGKVNPLGKVAAIRPSKLLAIPKMWKEGDAPHPRGGKMDRGAHTLPGCWRRKKKNKNAHTGRAR